MRFSRTPWLGVVAVLSCALAAFVIFAPQHNTNAEEEPCVTREFENSRFIVCRFDARRDELRLASRGAAGEYLRGFEALASHLGRDARRVRFAMNAGMYNDAGAPIGLYIADGAQERGLSLTDGPGNFHMKPNGVFWQGSDGTLHVDTSEGYAAAQPSPRWATQSGPMLVIDGEMHPRFQHDGPSRYTRNAVGIVDEHTAYFVITSGVVSFGRFARFFRDELNCDNALFFDGAVSSLWAPSLERQDTVHAIGPMIVVLER